MSNEFIPQNLYGNATGLYQDILEEIEEMWKDNPLTVSRAKQLAMPAIAKVLQNKLVISMDRATANQQDIPGDENEFVQYLEQWDTPAEQDITYELISRQLNRIADSIRQKSSLKAQYATFLELFSEDEREDVFTAIFFGRNYFSKKETPKEMIFNYVFIDGHGEAPFHPLRYPENLSFYERTLYLTPMVKEGEPMMEASWDGEDDLEYTVDYVSEQEGTSQSSPFLKELQESVLTNIKGSSDSIAYYKQWVYVNKQDPLGMFKKA